MTKQLRAPTKPENPEVRPYITPGNLPKELLYTVSRLMETQNTHYILTVHLGVAASDDRHLAWSISSTLDSIIIHRDGTIHE